MKRHNTTWRHRQTQHLANDVTVTSSIFGEQAHIDLAMGSKVRGVAFELSSRLSAEEARLVANDLFAAAEVLSLSLRERSDEEATS